MSVKIDNMGETTFNTNTVAPLRPNPDTTTFASTCSQVKNFISSFLIPLTFNDDTSIIGTWTSVLTNLIKTLGTSSTNIRGSVLNIGGASTTVKVLGNTLNVDDTFPTILSGVANMGRIQAGYVTVPTGTTLISPPVYVPSGTRTFLVTGTTNSRVGGNGLVATGFNISSLASQEVNWIYFY